MPKSKKVKTEEEKQDFRGISAYAIALVYDGGWNGEEQRPILQADNPTPYLEARLAVASRREKKEAFERVMADVRSGRYERTPYLQRWDSKKGRKLTFEDLEERIQAKNDSMSLTREEAVQVDPTNSTYETLVMQVRSRTSAVPSNGSKYWRVTMHNFSIIDGQFNPWFSRMCGCPFSGTTDNKGRLWQYDDDEAREETVFLDRLFDKILTKEDEFRQMHLVCEHEATAATELELQNNKGKEQTIPHLRGKTTSIAFDFIDKWDMVFEAMARKYKYKQDMADIDAYAWQFEDEIITPPFKEYRRRGIINREVIKSGRFFDDMQKQIIMAIYEFMHQRGYKYRRFSRECNGFQNRFKNYETVGIVFEKHRPGAKVSYRVIYDSRAKIFLPYILKYRFLGPSEPDRKPTPYQRTPLRLWQQRLSRTQKRPVYIRDDRSGKIAELTVFNPLKVIPMNIPGAEERYAKALEAYIRTDPELKKLKKS